MMPVGRVRRGRLVTFLVLLAGLAGVFAFLNRSGSAPTAAPAATAVAVIDAATPNAPSPAASPGAASAPVDLIALVPGPEPARDRIVRLLIEPVKIGANRVVAYITDAGGELVPATDGEVESIVVTALELTTAPRTLRVDPTADGRYAVEDITFDQEGWWRLEVRLRRPQGGAVVVPFYLLAPDPNLYGAAALPIAASPPEAVAVYERGLATMTALHRVRYRQTMGSGIGTAAFAEHDVTDGSDGRLPALRYRAWGGIEGYVIGDRLWYRRAGEAWTTAETTPIVLPTEWDEEFTGATGFRLGRTEVVDGEPCQIVTFVAPVAKQRDIAWYAWWVGLESGQVRRETMVADSHYMLTEYRDFDAPLTIDPPAGPITTPST